MLTRNVFVHLAPVGLWARKKGLKGRRLALLLLGFCYFFAAGCAPEAGNENQVVVRVGETQLTRAQFDEAFALASAPLPAKNLAKKTARKEARRRFLETMVEQMAILERARELGLTVSPDQVEKAVALARGDMDRETFGNMLAETGISMAAWQRGQKRRLLMEKTMELELTPLIRLSDADVAECFNRLRSQTGDRPVTLSATQVRRLAQREKMEQAYGPWLEGLKARYPIWADRENV